jgi:hypothetical protein
MFIIQDSTTIIVLPNPIPGNTESLSVLTTVRRAMDGSLFGHKKSSSRKIYEWTFETVNTNVMDNLRTFIDTNRGQAVTVTTDDGEVITGTFREDAIEFVTTTCITGSVSLSIEG